MDAEDIMVTEVVTVRSDDSVGTALEILSELDVRHLPVLDDGELVGMLSDRDLRTLGVYRLRDLESVDRVARLARLTVADIMSADVVSVEGSADVREVIDLMIEEHIGAVPVCEPHTRQLVGIISYVDVLKAASRMLDEREAPTVVGAHAPSALP